MQKPTPRGLEKDPAFAEYRSLNREQREKIKASAFEVPDLKQISDKSAQLDALREVVEAQVEVLRANQAQLTQLKTVLHTVSGLLLHLRALQENGDDTLDEYRAATIRMAQQFLVFGED